MKKIFALILAVMMIATMSVTAFAAENTGGDTTINVKGTYTGAQGAGDKISVDVAWKVWNLHITKVLPVNGSPVNTSMPTMRRLLVYQQGHNHRYQPLQRGSKRYS